MNTEGVITFAASAHGEQMYGGVPYIVHLLLVARHFDGEPYQTVAILHDIVEDTYITLDQIRETFGPVVVGAIDCLSRRKDELYLTSYIRRVAQNEVAREVKIADLQENIRSASMWYNEYLHLIPRYREALSYLMHIRERLHNALSRQLPVHLLPNDL